jgi:hypothetical protein
MRFSCIRRTMLFRGWDLAARFEGSVGVGVAFWLGRDAMGIILECGRCIFRAQTAQTAHLRSISSYLVIIYPHLLIASQESVYSVNSPSAV